MERIGLVPRKSFHRLEARYAMLSPFFTLFMCTRMAWGIVTLAYAAKVGDTPTTILAVFAMLLLALDWAIYEFFLWTRYVTIITGYAAPICGFASIAITAMIAFLLPHPNDILNAQSPFSSDSRPFRFLLRARYGCTPFLLVWRDSRSRTDRRLSMRNLEVLLGIVFWV